MRLLILLVSLLLYVPAWASTTYIDPSCTFNGDGTVGAPCAVSGGAVGPMNAWPAVSGADAQFLQKAGTTSLVQVTVSSGSAGHPVILGAYGTGAKPILRSEEGALTGTIKIGTDAHDVTIDGLEVHGQLNLSAGQQANAIRNNTTAGSSSVVVNITVQNCTIGPVVEYGGADDDDGIDIRGQGIVILNNTIVNIANDGMNLVSSGAVGDVVIRGNTCSRVGQVGTSGDCYQVSGTSTAMLIETNYCDHSDTDVKQCIVSNSDVDIRYNELHGVVNATVNTPIYCDGGQCRIYGNRIYYGRLCIQNYGTAGSTTYSNLCLSPATYGIEVNAVSGTAYNNTVVGIVEDTVEHNGFAAVRLTTAATNATAWNNVVGGAFQGIRLVSGSGQTESNNLFYGNVPTHVYDTTLSASISATNPVTTSTNQFLNATALDYRTLGNSVARAAGKTWADCRDLRGRVCHTPPDIGAYQASSGDPANTRTARSQYIFQPVASSTFSGGNANPISEGGVWSTNNSGAGDFQVATGAASPTSRFSDSGARYIGTGFNANQYSRGNLTISGTAGSAAGIGLSICASSSAQTMYRFTIDHNVTTNAYLYRFVEGAGSLLTGGSWLQTFSDADQFTLANVGETIYVFKGSTLVKTIDDTGGGVGCASTRFPGMAHSSTTTSSSIDNWSGGNFRLAY